jgi:pectate lyase
VGTRVQYNGNIYENNWYSQNQNPEQNSGEFDVWSLVGSCDPNITPAPTTPGSTDPPSTPEPTIPGPTSPPGDIAVPNGFAEGTTGGGNASPRTVSSASEFRSAVSGDSAKVIIVNGRYNLGGDINIGSNTTIKGANSSSGLYGGAIKIGGSNYIIQNLTFGPTSGDVMEISGGSKVFIHKCAFHDSTDELCSIVRGADYVTVSWCKFYFDNPDDHSLAHLIGNSDSATGDRGKLHVTMHHNWYHNGVRGRQPRVRFGHVHLYNNFYNSNNTDYCIGIGVECHVRVENSHFKSVDDPWADYGGSGNGEIGWSNLKFESCSQPTFMSNAFPVFSPPYGYSMDPVDQVENIVKAGAGNVF